MIKNYLNLIRVKQWYKNLVVFLAIFFSGNLFNYHLLYLSSLAFISLSLISSAGYIINDLADLKSDKNHPEKKLRPLASEKIKSSSAIVLALILIALGFWITIFLPRLFLYLLIGFIALKLLYTFYLKKIIFADILTIATLFVLRAIAGALATTIEISPWLILVPFFLAIFLATGKRNSDLLLLKDQAVKTRKVLQQYNLQITNALMIITTTLFIISFALYVLQSQYSNLLYTLPLAVFVILRYYYFVQSGSIIARQPEKIITDRPFIVVSLLWIIITGVLIYL